jgi:hypothetical protein
MQCQMARLSRLADEVEMGSLGSFKSKYWGQSRGPLRGSYWAFCGPVIGLLVLDFLQ